MKFLIKVGKLDFSYEDLQMDIDVRALVRAMNLRRFVVDVDTDEIDEVEEPEPLEEEAPQQNADLLDGYERFRELMEDWIVDWEDKDPVVAKQRADLISGGVHGNILKYIKAAGGLTRAAWVVLEDLGHTKEEVLEYVGAMVQTASVLYPPLSDTWIPNDNLEAK